jgi:DNA-binding MarR family transcriptional regulator
MLLLKEVPQYECLLERAKRYPELDPSAMEAFLHMMRTSTEVFEAFRALLARHEISQGRFTVLILLNRHTDQSLNLADLAKRSRVTRATMTGLIDTLERDGLVKREHSEDDRRMLLVRLTDTGKTYLDKILPDYFRRVATVMGRLTEAERKILVGLMGKIAQVVPEISDRPPLKASTS